MTALLERIEVADCSHRGEAYISAVKHAIGGRITAYTWILTLRLSLLRPALARCPQRE